MARQKGYVAFVLFLEVSSVVAGGDLSDFTNNLAQDLGPLLTLFGDAITKQYLSESTTFLDYFIFALGPLGILTAITSVVRLCGHSSLLALIGRSQESAAAVEAELCTSTSRDVCELFNQRGIARVLGRPSILEVVLLTPDGADTPGERPAARLMLLTKYFNKPEISSSQWKYTRNSIFSKKKVDVATVKFAPEPNLSLNVGIKKVSTWFAAIVALFGLVCQVGVLTLAGYGAWRLDWNLHADNTNSSSRDYAPRMFLAGTILLSLGMWSCAAIIGQSTQEICFSRVEGTEGMSSRLIWLQPGQQLIGDQYFDSYLYMENKNEPLERWVSSKSRDDLTSKGLFELLTFGAVFSTTVGYIIQFIGIRGLKAWVSLAQLGITLTMSILRGSLRLRRLQKTDNKLYNMPDLVSGSELDSLALRLATETSDKQPRYDIIHWISPDFSLQDNSHESTHETTTVRAKQNGYWYVAACVAAGESAMGRESFLDIGTAPNPQQISSTNSESGQKKVDEHVAFSNYGRQHPYVRAFDIRTQLAVLTGNLGNHMQSMDASSYQLWKPHLISVRQMAVRLSLAVGQVADELFGPKPGTTAKLVLKSVAPIHAGSDESPDGESQGAVDFAIDLVAPSPKSRTWACDAAQIEAALGLWHWNLVYFGGSVKTNPVKNMPSFQIVSAGRANDSWKRNTDIEVVLEQWLDKREFQSTNLQILDIAAITCPNDLQIKMHEFAAHMARPVPFDRVFGWNVAYHSLKLDTRRPLSDADLFSSATSPEHQGSRQIRMQCVLLHRSLIQCCACQLFVALAMALVCHANYKFPETTVEEADGQLQFRNPVMKALQSALVDNEIGTAAEAIFSFVPAFRENLKPCPAKLSRSVLENSKIHQVNGEEQRAEVILRWGCDAFYQYCLQSDAQKLKFLRILRATGELYRESCTGGAVDRFVDDGIKWMITNYGTVENREERDIVDCYEKVLGMLHQKRAKLAPDDRATIIVAAIRDNDRATTLYHLCYLIKGDFGTSKLQPAVPLAVRNGWTEVVDDMLEKKANKDSRDEKGRTAVSHCAETGNVQLFDTLMGAGAFLDQPDNNLFSPLHWSAVAGTPEMAKLLLFSGKVDLERLNNKKMTPLCCAVEHNNPEVVTKLLDSGANPNVIQGTLEESLDEPLLFLAVKRGYFACASQLIQWGAKVNEAGWRGRTALHVAAEVAGEEMADLLLRHDADSKLANGQQETPLHIAAQVGNDAVCSALARHGADINAVTPYNTTALQRAAMYGHATTVSTLLELGANSSIKDQHGRSALHHAAACNQNDSVHAMEALVGHGASIHETDTSGASALYRAVEAFNNDAIEILLGFGADINQVTIYGTTALQRAAGKNNREGMKILLGHDADPNICETDGQTALMDAARSGNLECVRMLLEAGADPSAENEAGKTAATLGAECGNPLVRPLILSKMTAHETNRSADVTSSR